MITANTDAFNGLNSNQDLQKALLIEKSEEKKKNEESKKAPIVLRNPFWKPDDFGEEEIEQKVEIKADRHERHIKKDLSDVTELKFKNLVQTKNAWREMKASEDEVSLVPGKGKTMNIVEPLKLEHEGKAKEVREGREFLGNEECGLI